MPPAARRDRSGTSTRRSVRASRPPSPAAARGGRVLFGPRVCQQQLVAIAARRGAVPFARRNHPLQSQLAEGARSVAHVCAAGRDRSETSMRLSRVGRVASRASREALLKYPRRSNAVIVARSATGVVVQRPGASETGTHMVTFTQGSKQACFCTLREAGLRLFEQQDGDKIKR